MTTPVNDRAFMLSLWNGSHGDVMRFATERSQLVASMMLEIAHVVAKRSHCARANVGAVVTDAECLQILGFGYNGQPRGLPNQCLSPDAGLCGCVHAELNALLKAPGALSGKLLFSTHAPCINCARAIANAGIARVHYVTPYRTTAGLDVLEAAGIEYFAFLPLTDP